MSAMTPSDADVLEALRVLRAWFTGGVTAEPASYSAAALPPGVTRAGYLRRHARRVREGVPGWTRVGHARVVSREAWELDVAAETNRRRTMARETEDEKIERQLREAGIG